METFEGMLGMVLLFAALLIPGYILGKTGLIGDAATVSFSNLLMYVAMPFLVFSKLLEMDLSAIGVWELAVSALLPIVLVALLYPICILLCRAPEVKRRAMMFCAIFPNCGFLGIPLAGAIWPDRPQIVVYISVFNVVSTFLLLTVGVCILSGDRQQINLKKTLVNPILFAVILGVICSYFKVSEHVGMLLTYSETLAQLTTPLAMTVLGFELSKLRFFEMWKNAGVYLTSLIKLCISPLLALGVLLLCRACMGMELGEDLLFAMLIATAVSTAASAPAMAKKYGADAEYAATLTLTDTLLCVAVLPLLYLLFCQLL